MPKYNFSIILISLACKICIFKIKRVFVSQSNPKSQFPKFWNHEFLLKFWDFCLRYIFWSYISHFKSNLSGVKSKSVIHIMRPHIEKKNAKIFKIGRVIAIFVRLTEFRNESKKSRKAVFQPFWINTKKSYFIQIFNPGHNIMSLLKRKIPIFHCFEPCPKSLCIILLADIVSILRTTMRRSPIRSIQFYLTWFDLFD